MPHGSRKKMSASSHNEPAFRLKQRKPVPHAFALDALAPVSPWTRPMFGCTAVYVEDRIVFALRDKPTYPRDNGVWLATTREHHASLRSEFPNMRSIGLLGKKVTGWQLLPAEALDFEESVVRACELICTGDPRIGKVPGRKRSAGGKSGRSPTKGTRKEGLNR